MRHIESSGRLSKAIVHDGLVWLAGLVGTPNESIEEQARTALAQLDGYLAQAGTDKSRLLQVTIWLSDIRDYDRMNAIWDGWVQPGPPPARACIEARLATPDYNFEVMGVAALPE